MHLEIDKLQAFVEVARTGSFREAARRLHVTPSAISHALKKLQEGLGRELLTFRGRKLSLTEAGNDLFATGQRVFDELDDASQRLTTSSDETPLHLVLGATIEFGTTVLLRKLAPLVEAHPQLRLDFHFSNDLKEALLADTVDLAVDCRPHTHPTVHCLEMFRERYVVVATPLFLAQHKVKSPLDLRRTPVLSFDAEGAWWNNFLQALPTASRPTLERLIVIDHVRGMINGTLADYGVSLLPKYAILNELTSRALVQLFPRLEILEDSFCIYQKVGRVSRPANQLVSQYLTNLDVREFGDAIGRHR